MKSLTSIQNSGLGAFTVLPMPDDYQETQAWYDMDYARRQLAASKTESAAFYNAPPTPEPPAGAAPVSVVSEPEKLLNDARRMQFLASTRPGFDYGAGSGKRNSLFSKDTGLGFDLMAAVVDSLKSKAPSAFQGINGKVVLASIVPNAGGPSLAKVSLPSWLPKISVPLPIQDAAKRAANLAAAVARDVAAKKKAESGAGVAVQTQEYPGGASQGSNAALWIGGGVLALVVAAYASRKK